MKMMNYLLIPSKTRYEINIASEGSVESAKRLYLSEDVWNNIVESDHVQKQNLEMIKEALGEERILENRTDLTPKRIADNDLFITLGGDNHFAWTSQVILEYMRRTGERKYVTSVLADTKKSWGGIVQFRPEYFLKNFEGLLNGNFPVEDWTTLEATVKTLSGQSRPYIAIDNYAIGEHYMTAMSRNRIFLDGKPLFGDKSGGILLAVGAGSGKGAWYYNEHVSLFGGEDVFSKISDEARILLRGIPDKSKETFYRGQVLEFHSYNDSKGIIIPDGEDDHGVIFPMGSIARVKISEVKLPVVVNKGKPVNYS